MSNREALAFVIVPIAVVALAALAWLARHRSGLRDILLAMLLALLISVAGVAWIDYDVPGAWPDLIGPSDWGGREGASH
jgi:apolipoprotein N-acyltransferase